MASVSPIDGSDDESLRPAVDLLLAAMHGGPQRIVRIRETEGEQGASGASIRYFDVTSTATGSGTARVARRSRIVSKAADLRERRVVAHLSGQGCAVPVVVIPDTTTEGRAPIWMPYLDARPPLDLGHPESPLTRSIADGLAGIHAANRGQPLPWLPHVAEDVLGLLWLRAWRERWDRNLSDPEFAAEFRSFTRPLERASERLLELLRSLTAEADTLTLLNVDLIPDHIRLYDGEARFIDWQQAAYGSLYLDLPNHFTLETALVYRDALARRGHEIPVPDFLERYRDIGRYMGLRYLAHALGQWTTGGEARAKGRWFLHYTLTLALRGR